MKRLVLIMLIFFIIGSNLKAFIEGITIWENDKQRIYTCGDFHDHVNDPLRTFEQSEFICYKVLDKIDPKTVCVMAEDFKGYEGNNEDLKKLTDRYFALSAQNGLTLPCKELGLDIINLEYRFARIAAVSPLKNSKLKPEERFEKSAKTTIFAREIVEEFDDMVKLVSQFDDGSSLNDYYDEHCKAVCSPPNDKILNDIRAFSGSIGDYIKSKIIAEKHLKFVWSLLLWDARLLDLRAIHEIVNHAHKKKLFIFTGSGHSYLIGQALQNHLGYKKKSVIGKERPRRYVPWILDVESNQAPRFSDESISGKKMEWGKPLTNDELSILFEDFKEA